MKISVAGRSAKVPAIGVLLILFLHFTGCDAEFLLGLRVRGIAPAVDLERDFGWYKSQMNTGRYSSGNCGPTCVSMAVKYFQDRDVTVEEVRNANPKGGGWWNEEDVLNALDRYHVAQRRLPLFVKEQLFTSLSENHPVILCLNMTVLTRAARNSDAKYNRYYDNVTGHFIIIKGYTEDKQWFIAYDPNTWANDYYPDRTPKGKDRLYRVSEVVFAAKTWNTFYLEL